MLVSLEHRSNNQNVYLLHKKNYLLLVHVFYLYF